MISEFFMNMRHEIDIEFKYKLSFENEFFYCFYIEFSVKLMIKSIAKFAYS